MNMPKAKKIIAVLSLLCAISFVIWSVFFPRPGTSGLYSILLLAAVFLAVAEYWWPWPKFKAFMRGLPTVIRLFMVGALVLMVFIDMQASGFAPWGILAILLTLSIALYLWKTRTNRMS